MKRIIWVLIIATITSCKTKRESMKEINTEVTTKDIVEVQANLVWKKLIAFDGTEKFVPELIEKVDLEGKGIGTIRNIYLKGGGKIVEELTKVDSSNHSMEFIILSTPMPISNYTGICKVREITNNKCEVTFTSKYSVSKENEKEIESVIKGFQETFISNLDK